VADRLGGATLLLRQHSEIVLDRDLAFPRREPERAVEHEAALEFARAASRSPFARSVSP
jgi:hypothetical protein